MSKMISAYEIAALDHKDIARVLNYISNFSATCDVKVNKMMENIHWQYGMKPLMKLNGQIKKCDIVAKTILETPLLNIAVNIIIVEIISGNDRQFIGIALLKNGKIVNSRISCIDFISWFNGQNIAVGIYLVANFRVIASSDNSTHIRCDFL